MAAGICPHCSPRGLREPKPVFVVVTEPPSPANRWLRQYRCPNGHEWDGDIAFATAQAPLLWIATKGE